MRKTIGQKARREQLEPMETCVIESRFEQPQAHIRSRRGAHATSRHTGRRHSSLYCPEWTAGDASPAARVFCHERGVKRVRQGCGPTFWDNGSSERDRGNFLVGDVRLFQMPPTVFSPKRNLQSVFRGTMRFILSPATTIYKEAQRVGKEFYTNRCNMNKTVPRQQTLLLQDDCRSI